MYNVLLLSDFELYVICSRSICIVPDDGNPDTSEKSILPVIVLVMSSANVVIHPASTAIKGTRFALPYTCGSIFPTSSGSASGYVVVSTVSYKYLFFNPPSIPVLLIVIYPVVIIGKSSISPLNISIKSETVVAPTWNSEIVIVIK